MIECSIEESVDGTYIIVNVTGELTRRTIIPYMMDAQGLGARLGISCFLVDATKARNIESQLGNYDFVHEDLEATGAGRTSRVALLVSPGDHSHDFLIEVSRKAFHDFAIFTKRTDAVRFLQKVNPLAHA